jgi:hypothetical protein
MADLRIARDLALPIDIVTQAIAILARKGAGKTYTAKKLVELVIGAKVPVVVIDPTGGWWGLRTSADGEKPGLPVVIFGGDHADVPLERGAGKEIADVVLEHAGAYVLDLSGFESRTAEQTFVADFLERLYRGKKRETGPLLLVVDEADMFAPQRPGPEQTRSLGALEAIVRRGRIKGLGDLLITQRAAVLNKNVLTQTEVLVVMQTTGPQDRAAIDAWIEGNGTREERDTVLASLASLERGEAWVWSPSFLRILQRVRILPGTTFDSSRTPEAGEVTIAPRAFAQVDVDKLGARIQQAIEKAKADDPRELRRRIRELELNLHVSEQELAKKPTPEPEVREVRVEVPVLNGQVGELRTVLEGLKEFGEWMAAGADRIVLASDNIVAAIDRVQSRTQERGQAERAPRGVPVAGREARITGSDRGDSAVATLARSAPSRTPAPMSSDPVDVKLKAGARRMLSALAMLHPTPLTRGQVATLSDISPTSGTFSDYLSAIRSAGYILEEGRTIALSDAGQAIVAGELGGGAPSSGELLEMWGRKLKAGARRMLGVLHDVYPDGLTRAELGERAEISPTSGTFSDYLSMLRRNGLLDESGSVIRAGEALFLGER